MPEPLSWESTYAIALELKRRHPNINMAEVTLSQIYEWALALPEFQDELSLCNDGILFAIFQDWYEETIHE